MKKADGKKKKSKYKRGRYPYTILDTDREILYVRKTYQIKEPIAGESGEITFVTKSKQIWRKCEPQTEARAEEVLAEITSDIEFKISGKAKPLSGFNEIADEFEKIELSEPIFGSGGQKIGGLMSAPNQKYLLKNILDYFGNRQIADIHGGDLQTFKLNRLRTPVERNNKFSPRTLSAVNHELSLLKKIFKFAIRRRWLDRSPFDEVPGLIDAANENRRHVKLSRLEEKSALALCVGNKLEHMRTLITCIVDGGFRRGEILNAKWSSVNWDEGFIPAKSYKGKKLTVRPIYMTKRMRETLLWWKEAQKKNPRITDKTRIIGYSDVDTAWHTIREGIKRTDVTIHDLRHVFATRAYFEAKISLYEVSLMLGHSNIKTTQIYINAQDVHIKDAVSKLDDLNDSIE